MGRSVSRRAAEMLIGEARATAARHAGSADLLTRAAAMVADLLADCDAAEARLRSELLLVADLLADEDAIWPEDIDRQAEFAERIRARAAVVASGP